MQCPNSENSVEEDFIESWQSIVRFYESEAMNLFLGKESASLMVKLVNSMRQEGYDRHLRAGQAMHQLILSRSRYHGYFPKHYLCFVGECGSYSVNGKQKFLQSLKVSYHLQGSLVVDFEEDEIGLTQRIRQFLNNLLEKPIN